jgi:hypothetical protein
LLASNTKRVNRLSLEKTDPFHCINNLAMKTNQIFNFKRFRKYALSTLILRYRQLVLMIGAAISGIFLLSSLIIYNNTNWNSDSWLGFIITVTIVCGLLYTGSSFPSFRSREKTLGYLMVPVSSFEKILYEFVERVVVFVLFFPVFLYLFGNLAANMVTKIYQFQHKVVNIDHLSFINLIKNSSDGSDWVILTGSLAILLLAFAGTVSIKKYPLIKTFIFSMLVLFTIAGYFYLIMEKLKLQHPWIENIGDYLHKEQAISILTIVLLAFSLIIFCYSYFKLKEKEVQ